MKCAISDCAAMATTRGWCDAHYRRARLFGSPTAGGPIGTRKGMPLRFLAEATAYRGRDCLFWPYARNSAGYGHLVIRGKNVLAHRVTCEAINGPPSFAKAEAAHECGNGHLGCVNGLHLKWKDRLGNAADLVAHGRSQRGAKQHMSRLTEDAVRFIWANPELPPALLAAQFDVCPGAIYAVRRGASWKWLTDNLPRPEHGVVFHDDAASARAA